MLGEVEEGKFGEKVKLLVQKQNYFQRTFCRFFNTMDTQVEDDSGQIENQIL